MMKDPDRPDVPDPGAFTDPSPSPADDPDLAVLGDALQECGVARAVILRNLGEDAKRRERIPD